MPRPLHSLCFPCPSVPCAVGGVPALPHILPSCLPPTPCWLPWGGGWAAYNARLQGIGHSGSFPPPPLHWLRSSSLSGGWLSFPLLPFQLFGPLLSISFFFTPSSCAIPSKSFPPSSFSLSFPLPLLLFSGFHLFLLLLPCFSLSSLLSPHLLLHSSSL